MNQLSEMLKAVLPASVPQGERADPDPTPVRQPPLALPPSTTLCQPGEQREPVRTDQIPEKLSKIMERTAQSFCKQLRHMHRAKERLEQATETVKFLKENLSRYPSGCRRCITWSELDETWQRAGEADHTWHIRRVHHAFTTFQKEVEAQAQEALYRNLSTRATRGAYDSVMRSSIEEFVKSEHIDINGDKPTSGVSNQVIEQFSAELCKKAYERVVKEIVDKRERIAKHLKHEAKTKVSSCVKKIVTTASTVQEEVKATDVVSAHKKSRKVIARISKRTLQKRDTPGAVQGKGNGVQQTKKGKRKGKGWPKNKSKEGKGQGTAANKSQLKSSGKGKKNTSKGQGTGKGKKGGKNGGKTGGTSKVLKLSTTR